MSVSLLKIAADLQLSLAAAVTVGQTTATLSSASDSDGVALPSGKYGFTIDGDTSAKEYIVCDLVGTALTNVQNISRQGAATIGFANYHRFGATVTITDWAILDRMLNNLTGDTGFDSAQALSYDGAVAGLTGNQIPTVNYVLSVVNGGAVTFDQQVVSNQTAGENLTALNLVYFKESDQKWWKVDADTTATFSGVKLGIALGTVSADATTTIAISGPVTMTGLTAGAKYYASGTAGAIVSSIPTAPTYEVFVGIALSTTSLLLAPLVNTNQFAGTLGNPSSTNKFLSQENEYSADVDQSQATQNSSSTLGEADTTTLRNKLAQSYVAGRIKVRGVELYKSADTGTFTGTVTVALQADTAGSPSGSNLASVTITNAQWLTITTGAFQVPFSAEYSQVIGTTYWIVLTTSTSDTSNHPNIGIDTAGGYASGEFKYNNTTDGWVTVSGQDMYFKTLNGVLSQIPLTDSTSGQVLSTVLPYSLVDVSTTDASAITGTTETTVYTKKLDANFFKLNSGIKVTNHFTWATGTATLTLRIKLNGTEIVAESLGSGASGNTKGVSSVAYIVNNASLSVQKYKHMYSLINTTTGAGSINVTDGTAAIDTSGPVVLTITLKFNNTNDSPSVTFPGCVVEKIG